MTRNPSTQPTAPAEQAGFTMMETVISIGLIAVMLAIYSTTVLSTMFLRRAQYHTQAANYIQEELDTLRSLPFNELLTRTNGRFLGVAMQRGRWAVTNVADAQGNRLTLGSPPAAGVDNETGLAILPGNYRSDFTLSAKMRVDSTSPAGWGASLAFRYRDAENHYRLRMSSGGLSFLKIYRGAETLLWSKNTTFNTNTWYTIGVAFTGNVFTPYIGGSPVPTPPAYPLESTFLTGDLALMSSSGAKVSFDDVSVTENSVTTAWNFTSDVVNTCPADWQRISCLDLPGGNCQLTIENYLGESTIKKATATVSWSDAGITKSVAGSTVIGQ